jgi:hypothetical protein
MPRDDSDDLAEVFAGLDLPPDALRAWFADLDRFCRAHGGERRYRELMTLLDSCRDAATKWRR